MLQKRHCPPKRVVFPQGMRRGDLKAESSEPGCHSGERVRMGAPDTGARREIANVNAR